LRQIRPLVKIHISLVEADDFICLNPGAVRTHLA
jgi:hypothetical protein